MRRLGRVIPTALLLAASTLTGLAVTPASAGGHSGHIRGTETYVGDHGAMQSAPIEAFPVRNAATGPAVIAGNISYTPNTPVMINPNIYIIWYGDWASNACTATDNSTPGLVNNFLSAIGTSDWYGINRTYYQTISGVTTYVTSTVNKSGCTSLSSASYGTSLAASGATSVGTIVSDVIRAGTLPSDANGLYFVLTSPGIREGSFLTSYCGYHSYLNVNSITPKYSFVGDATGASLGSCALQTTQSPNNNPGGDALISVFAHELVEAVSDPMLNTWVDSGGNENADKCAWTFGTTRTAPNGSTFNTVINGVAYAVQQNWNASTQGCQMPTSANTMNTFTGSPSVTISGTGTVGQTLTSAASGWTPTPSAIGYQWMRGTSPIPGANNATYTLTASDAGASISLAASALSATYYPNKATSNSISVAAASFISGTPTISGNTVVGSVLTAATGTWTPAATTYAYQWLRNGATITGATRSTYTLVSADSGTSISVRITATRTGYTSAIATSAAVGPITTPGTVTTGTVTISGTTTDGQVLTASPGIWGPAPVTLTYQWLRAGATISGATAATYTLTGADIGRAISVRVTGTKTGYTSASITSATTANVIAATFGGPTPTISGTAVVGNRLTANPGTWSPSSGTTLSYQWKRNGANISRATAATYTLVTADRGTTITVTVTGSRTGYTAVQMTSNGVGPIA